MFEDKKLYCKECWKLFDQTMLIEELCQSCYVERLKIDADTGDIEQPDGFIVFDPSGHTIYPDLMPEDLKCKLEGSDLIFGIDQNGYLLLMNEAEYVICPQGYTYIYER